MLFLTIYNMPTGGRHVDVRYDYIIYQYRYLPLSIDIHSIFSIMPSIFNIPPSLLYDLAIYIISLLPYMITFLSTYRIFLYHHLLSLYIAIHS